ncbi:MarR family transcriptional regulator [bacterium]|nr:MarR family transcriptional regulator [bacterium]
MPHRPDASRDIPDDGPRLPVLRALYRTFAAVDRVSARHIDSLGLTQARFDVISTLGDTPGMTVKQLCDAALITKGTLLHVLGSLEALELVERGKGEHDQRQTIVSLTPKGQALYEETFLPHVGYMRQFFEQLTPQEQATLVFLLGRLEDVFTQSSKPAAP